MDEGQTIYFRVHMLSITASTLYFVTLMYSFVWEVNGFLRAKKRLHTYVMRVCYIILVRNECFSALENACVCIR